MNQIGNGANFQAMLAGELEQLRQPRHRAVLTHDFANHADGPATREAHQVHRGFRMPRALQNAAGPRAQRKYMAGLHQIFRHRGRVRHDADRFRAIAGADAAADAARGINADLEIRFKTFAVLTDHSFDAELLEAFGSHRHADQSAPVFGHEIDGRGRDKFGRHDQVAFVLPVRVVHHDHQLALLQIGGDGFDAVKTLFDHSRDKLAVEPTNSSHKRFTIIYADDRNQPHPKSGTRKSYIVYRKSQYLTV